MKNYPVNSFFLKIFTPNFGEDERILTCIYFFRWVGSTTSFLRTNRFFWVHFLEAPIYKNKMSLNTPPPPAGSTRLSESGLTLKCVVSFQCGRGDFVTWLDHDGRTQVLNFSRWWFQIFFICTPIRGRFPIRLIFLRWVETTNQNVFYTWSIYVIDNLTIHPDIPNNVYLSTAGHFFTNMAVLVNCDQYPLKSQGVILLMEEILHQSIW